MSSTRLIDGIIRRLVDYQNICLLQPYFFVFSLPKSVSCTETSSHRHPLLLVRFPNIACELLTSDVSIINDKLGADESLLEMLYHFLEQDPPLNPLLASFFSKTIGNLIARKTEQVRQKLFLAK